MNAWIVYAVGFSQIVVLYFLALPYCLRMTYSLYLGKNRQWVDDNPAFRERYPEPKYSVWLSFLVGVGLLVFFLRKLFTGTDESWQIDLLTTTMLPFSAIYVFYGIVECFRVRKKIPLPVKRSVVLERRSLESMVSPRLVFFGYLLMTIGVVAFCFAFSNDRIDAHVFAKHIIGTTAMTFIMTLGLIVSVRRKKQSLDEMWGPSYRRSEAIFCVICLYLLAMGNLIVALQYLFSVQWLTRIDAAVALSVLIQAGMFYMGRHAWPKHPNRPAPSITI